ncbi:protein-glutamate O-methyltransferase CheR [Steroidobacter sp. S1-65]|uniref:protein-glutamate O-methyltransferase n=1 Tax=Steroidobacter gossypii TaxID=2805490 RepID=A0ABS1WVE2_9GAMM|nr:protein-glutamate O-methyltransferase CheR [Steroidobacter gossypii]MBM0104927.1 protein-glutamate O-methyltransferase CheR [Steroidobacter gossypii]
MLAPSAAPAGAEQIPSAQDENAFAAILGVLGERSGVDFRRYRLGTVRRRVLNRMLSARTRTFEDYLRLLRADADEAQHLLSRVTIKVSRFYRNAVTFDVLREQVIAEWAARRCDSPLQILSAGCGRGEEPYTLAMLLEDAGVPGTVEAMDIDSQALTAAAVGLYDEAALDELPPELRQRYLEPEGQRFRVCDPVRRRVGFTRQDITALTAASLQRQYDLVCCRNVLIYLEREMQEHTLSTLLRFIRPGGFLCLGEAEWPMPQFAASLQPLPHKTRIFRLYPGITHS